MILLAVKQYFQGKPTANLMELSYHFKKSPQMMRFVLQHWIRKGCLKVLPKPQQCGTRCTSCQPENAETYIWSE